MPEPASKLGKLLRWACLACLAGGGVLWALSPLGVGLSELKFKTPDVFWKLFASAPLLLGLGLPGLLLFGGRRGRAAQTSIFSREGSPSGRDARFPDTAAGPLPGRSRRLAFGRFGRRVGPAERVGTRGQGPGLDLGGLLRGGFLVGRPVLLAAVLSDFTRPPTFREPPRREVRGTPLPRTPVNMGQGEGRGVVPRPSSTGLGRAKGSSKAGSSPRP